MTDYTMIVQAHPPGLRWEYKFYMDSDRGAIEYTEGHTKKFAGVSWFHRMLLYRDDGTEDNFIGAFSIDAPTVTMK